MEKVDACKGHSMANYILFIRAYYCNLKIQSCESYKKPYVCGYFNDITGMELLTFLEKKQILHLLKGVLMQFYVS